VTGSPANGRAIAAGFYCLLENRVDEDEESEHFRRNIFCDPLEVGFRRLGRHFARRQVRTKHVLERRKC
jgi:hypothetical protein